MSNSTPLLDDAPWSPSLALRVEQVCNRFEAACKAGQRPQIEHYLDHTPEPERPVLLRELLALEVEYRRKSGEGVTPEEYCRQFAEYTELIWDILGRTQSCDPDSATPVAARSVAIPKAASDTLVHGDQSVPAVPGYEVQAELGRGGMGVVYRACQVRLKRLVALKMLLAGPQVREEQLARFRVEAEAVARLQHPHIVQIYEIGDHNHLPYLALEFVDGGNLDRQLAGTPQEPRATAALLETLAHAMHFAHQKGIVHRDLKPANVLLTREGTPKITDFGLAKQLDHDQGATQSGAVVGTPSYMAPEQAAGRIKEIGPAADVYALGAILYEGLTGRPPFKSTTAFDTLKQVLSQDPVPPRRLQPGVPRDLETICLKCLQKEPHHRYASALALAEDLHRYQSGEPIRARPAPALARAGRWVRRRPALAALLLFLGLAPFALLALLVWHDRDLAVKLDQAQTSAARTQRQADVEALLLKGKAARAAEDWQSAKHHFEAAIETAGADPSLAKLKTEAERQRDALTDRAARYDTFRKKCDEALFYESQFTGLPSSANVQATRTAARAALAVFMVRPAGSPRAILSRPTRPADSAPPGEGRDSMPPSAVLDLGPETWYTAAERAEIRSRCYELLLILAQAVAQPLEGEDPVQQADEALRVLDQAARLRSTRALHLCRAACLLRRNDTVAAARETAQAQRTEPADAVDYFLLGDECVHRKELPQAIAHYKDALRLQPDNFWAQYYLAVCSLQLQQPDQAETSLTVCQGRRPAFVWVYLLRGYASGQLGERARHKQQAAQHFAAAAADFRAAQVLLDRQPNEEAAYTLRVNRAATLILQAKYADARKDLQEAIRLKPKQYHAYLMAAQVHIEEKDHDGALAQLDTAIGLQPQLAPLHHKRGQVQRARRNLPEALRDFTQAVRLLTGGRLSATEVLLLGDAHAERGKILYEQKDYAKALKAFDDARTIRPNWLQLQRWRAALLQELRRYEEALRAYDDYLQQERKPAAEVYEARALVRTKLKDYAGAVADYTRALEIAPGSAPLHCYRGWTNLVSGAHRLALDDFNKAIKLDARNADAHVGRGSALVQLGRPQGLDDVQQGQRLGPVSPRLLWNAAQAYAQAAGKVGTEPGPWGREDPAARVAYQQQAVELLRKALLLVPAEERSSFWGDYIQDNAALSPIRHSPGFARLAAEYGPKK